MSDADSEEVGVPPIIVKAALYAVTGDVEDGEIRSYAQLTAFIAHLGKLPTKRLLDKLWTKGDIFLFFFKSKLISYPFTIIV